MEQKLAEFRARRRADVAARKSESFQKQPINSSDNGSTLKSDSCQSSTADPDTQELTDNPVSAVHQATRTKHWGDDWLLESTLGQWLGSERLAFTNLTLLKVLLWLVLLGLFAELEFGLPFFLISLFYWLYEGLRSPTARQPGEMSAYSVFNPDCQPLLGALTAEQLEGEMGYRPLANR
ncbi:SAYSvFN domain-containing protein 1-like [Salvelinus fontinalis]|uniref:SAYSvFN domain-containing protein 1-like n=1 Tax=Salvelinus fontinalis TaxID=8038 RepID=UPI0024859EB2|nr:SAYSvFN domain-containing protein 1-like [Salvelinus fontinalis]